jgi:hypothetical protein
MAKTEIIREEDLPAARLELRWREDGEWICDYNVVFPITAGDIRQGSPANHGSELRIPSGQTRVNGLRKGPMFDDGVDEIHTPFRASHHIAWDSFTSGLPAYVVYDGKAQLIEPTESTGEPIEDPEPIERTSSAWASETFTRKISDAGLEFERFANDVRFERDKYVKGSLPWSYYDALALDADNTARNLAKRFSQPFCDWIYNVAAELVGKTKVVCAECGADIPELIEEACEHIFDAEARLLLAVDDEKRRKVVWDLD